MVELLRKFDLLHRRSVGPPLAVVLAAAVLLAALEPVSPRALADSFVLSGFATNELSMPRNVSTGYNLSLTVLDDSPAKYLYLAGPTPSEPISFLRQLEGFPVPGQVEQSIQEMLWLHQGNWSLSFESEGRMAIVHNLPGLCGWFVTSTDLSSASCPRMVIEGPVAFALTTWSLDQPVDVRIVGYVEAYFFDKSLQPIGIFATKRFEGTMTDVVVVVPSAGTANVTFSFSQVAPPAGNSAVLATIAISLAVAFSVFGLSLWRKNRGRERERRG